MFSDIGANPRNSHNRPQLHAPAPCASVRRAPSASLKATSERAGPHRAPLALKNWSKRALTPMPSALTGPSVRLGVSTLTNKYHAAPPPLRAVTALSMGKCGFNLRCKCNLRACFPRSEPIREIRKIDHNSMLLRRTPPSAERLQPVSRQNSE
jgi:hypothetical protein